MTVYSPKIREELIPRIYEMARERRVTMTTLVNGIIEKALDEMEGGESDELERNRR